MADPEDLSDLDAHSVLVTEQDIMQPEETRTIMNLPVTSLSSQGDKDDSPVHFLFDPATQKLVLKGTGQQVQQSGIPGMQAVLPQVTPTIRVVRQQPTVLKQAVQTGVPVQLVTTRNGQRIIQLQSGLSFKGVQLEPVSKLRELGMETAMVESEVKPSNNQMVVNTVPIQTLRKLKLAPGQVLKTVRLQGQQRYQLVDRTAQGTKSQGSPVSMAAVRVQTPQRIAPLGKPKASPEAPHGTVYLSNSDGTRVPLQMTSVGGQLGYSIPANAVEPNKTFRIQTPAGAQLEGMVQPDNIQGSGMQLQIRPAPQTVTSQTEVPTAEPEPAENPSILNIKTVVPTEDHEHMENASILNIKTVVPSEDHEPVENQSILNIKSNTTVDRVISFESLSEPQKRKILFKMKNPITDALLSDADSKSPHKPAVVVQLPSVYDSPGRPMSPDLEFVSMKPPPAIMEGDIIAGDEDVVMTQTEWPTLNSEPSEGHQNGGWSMTSTLQLQEQATSNRKSSKKVRSLSFPVKVSSSTVHYEQQRTSLECERVPLAADVADTELSPLSAASDFVTLPAQVTMLPQLPPGHAMPGSVDTDISSALLQKVVLAAGLEIPSNFLKNGKEVPDQEQVKHIPNDSLQKSGFKIVGCLTFGCGIFEQLFAPRLILPQESYEMSDIAAEVTVEPVDVVDLEEKRIRDNCDVINACYVVIPERFLLPYEDAGCTKIGDRGQLSKSAIEDESEVQQDCEGKQSAYSPKMGVAKKIIEMQMLESDQIDEDISRFRFVVDEDSTQEEIETTPDEGASQEQASGEVTVDDSTLEEMAKRDDSADVLGFQNPVYDEPVALETSEDVQALLTTGVDGKVLEESGEKIVEELADLQGEAVIKFDMSAMPSMGDTGLCNVLYDDQGDEVAVALSEECMDVKEPMITEVSPDEVLKQNTSDDNPEMPLDAVIGEAATGDHGAVTESQLILTGGCEDQMKNENQGSIVTPDIEISTAGVQASAAPDLMTKAELESPPADQLPAADRGAASAALDIEQVMASASLIPKAEDCEDGVHEQKTSLEECQEMNTSSSYIDNDFSLGSENAEQKWVEQDPQAPTTSLSHTLEGDSPDEVGAMESNVETVSKNRVTATIPMKDEKWRHAYGCYFCPFSSWRPESIAEHWVATHLKSQPYVCAYCNFQSFSSQRIEEHSEHTHTSMTKIIGLKPSEIYQQRIVFEVSDKETGVAVPSVEHKKYGLIGEEFLGTIVSNEPHADSVNVTFHCIRCSYDSNNIRSMREHIREVHIQALPYHCPHCTTCFSTDLEAKRHVSLLHPERKELLVAWKAYLEISLHCLNSFFDVTFNESPIAEPNEKTFNPITQNYWSKSHSEELYCNFCSWKTKKLSKIWVHMRTIHELPTTMTCPRCSVESKLKQKDRVQGWGTCTSCRCFVPIYHVPNQKYTLGTRMYMCLCCNYRTHERSGVLRHVKYLHVKVQAFSCPYCSYRGVEKPKVRMHVMVHHPAAPLIVLKNIRMLQKYYDVVRGLFKEVLLDKNMLRRYKPGSETFHYKNVDRFGVGPKDEEDAIEVDVEDNNGFDLLEVNIQGTFEQTKIHQQKNRIKSSGPNKKKVGGKMLSARNMSFDVSQFEDTITVGGASRPRPKKTKGYTGAAAKSFEELMNKTKMDLKVPNNFRYYTNQDFNGCIHFKCSICEYRCLDRSCMSRHVKYIHLKAHPHSCRYCEYSNVERTKVKSHSMTFHRGVEPTVITDHQMLRVLGRLTKRYYVAVSASGKEQSTVGPGDLADACEWSEKFSTSRTAVAVASDSDQEQALVQPQGLPQPVVKVENAEEGSGVLGYGEVMADMDIKSEPESDQGEALDNGAMNLDLASMTQNLTPVFTKPSPGSYQIPEDVDDDDDGWLDDIQQLLNYHKRELEEEECIQEGRPAKWLKMDDETRADPKINMMPIVLVEDIVNKIMASV